MDNTEQLVFASCITTLQRISRLLEISGIAWLQTISKNSLHEGGKKLLNPLKSRQLTIGLKINTLIIFKST